MLPGCAATRGGWVREGNVKRIMRKRAVKRSSFLAFNYRFLLHPRVGTHPFKDGFDHASFHVGGARRA